MIYTVEEALASIDAGKLVVVQTDTVLGIIGDGNNETTVAQLYALKHREEEKSFVVFIKEQTDAVRYVSHIPRYADKFMSVFWPGALTLVFDVKEMPSQPYLSDNASIGLRVPNAKHLLSLLAKTDKTIISTSANLSGQKPLSSLTEAHKVFGDDVVYWDYRIEEQVMSCPSTVVDARAEAGWQILREGALTKEVLWQALDNE